MREGKQWVQAALEMKVREVGCRGEARAWGGAGLFGGEDPLILEKGQERVKRARCAAEADRQREGSKDGEGHPSVGFQGQRGRGGSQDGECGLGSGWLQPDGGEDVQVPGARGKDPSSMCPPQYPNAQRTYLPSS